MLRTGMCEKGSELAAVGRWDALLVWLTSTTALVRILLATVARESRKVDAEAESRSAMEQSIASLAGDSGTRSCYVH